MLESTLSAEVRKVLSSAKVVDPQGNKFLSQLFTVQYLKWFTASNPLAVD